MRTLAVALVALLTCAPLSVHAQVQTPAVPPEKAARPIASVALVNAGFESTQPGPHGAPEGWLAVQHAGPKSYTFTPDTTKPRSGERSLRVENIGPEPFGSIFQTVGAAPYRGRTLRFAAWIRTEGATGQPLRRRRGTQSARDEGWLSGCTRDDAQGRRPGHDRLDALRVALKVPDDADDIEVGLNLFGPGIAWLDDVALDVMDRPAAQAHTVCATARSDAPERIPHGPE